MADLTLANSTYSTGTNDTASTLVNNVSSVDAQQYNGVATACVGIETILGTGTTLKGSKADLVERLAVALNSDGTLKSSTTSAFNGTIPVSVGGTGATTLTDGAVLIGNSTGAVQALALPSTPKTLIHTGTAGADPAWGTGLIYHAPSSIGSGSTRTQETFTSATGNLSGVHFYNGDFTLNSGHTLTIPAGRRRLIIVATGTITINGTITASGAGSAGGTGGGSATAGGNGTDQPGGGGGHGGEAGGAVVFNGITIQSGGAGGSSGTAGTQVSGSSHPFLLAPFLMFGGAGGGGGIDIGSPDGGAGGGSIVLIAPTVVLAATAVLNTSGSAGSVGANNYGGGGGGGGNIMIIARSYTDNGCTFTMTGGAGGGSGYPGGAGATGVKQILIYA